MIGLSPEVAHAAGYFLQGLANLEAQTGVRVAIHEGRTSLEVLGVDTGLYLLRGPGDELALGVES